MEQGATGLGKKGTVKTGAYFLLSQQNCRLRRNQKFGNSATSQGPDFAGQGLSPRHGHGRHLLEAMKSISPKSPIVRDLRQKWARKDMAGEDAGALSFKSVKLPTQMKIKNPKKPSPQLPRVGFSTRNGHWRHLLAAMQIIGLAATKECDLPIWKSSIPIEIS